MENFQESQEAIVQVQQVDRLLHDESPGIPIYQQSFTFSLSGLEYNLWKYLSGPKLTNKEVYKKNSKLFNYSKAKYFKSMFYCLVGYEKWISAINDDWRYTPLF